MDVITSIVAKHLKTEGKVLRKKVRKTPHNAEKTERGDPLVSPGSLCYEEKQKKPVWFSSVGEWFILTPKYFVELLKNYFGQFVWIEKSHL